MKDILLDENRDLLFVNGDFAFGDSFEQEVDNIIMLTKGALKSDPLLGCDLVKYTNSPISANELKKIIKVNLARDKKRVNKIDVTDGKIIIQ